MYKVYDYNYIYSSSRHEDHQKTNFTSIFWYFYVPILADQLINPLICLFQPMSQNIRGVSWLAQLYWCFSL